MLGVERERGSRPKSSGLVRCNIKLPGVRKEAEQRGRTGEREVFRVSYPAKSSVQSRKQGLLRALIHKGRCDISPPALPLFQAHYSKKKSLTRISGTTRHSPARLHTPSTSIFRQSAYPAVLCHPSLRSYSSGPSLLACPGFALKQRLTGCEFPRRTGGSMEIGTSV